MNIAIFVSFTVYSLLAAVALPPATKVLPFGKSARLVRSMAFSPDGAILASGGDGKQLILWDLPNGRQLLSKEMGHKINSICFGPKGSMLACGLNGGEAVVLMIKKSSDKKISLEKRFAFPADSTNVYSVCISKDGKRLASTGFDGIDTIYDLQTAKVVLKVEGHKGTADVIAFHPEGATFVSVSTDIVFWDIRKRAETARLKGIGGVGAFAFSSDGKVFAATDNRSEIRLWEFLSKKPLGRLRTSRRDADPFAFGPDGTLLVSGHYSGDVNLWNIKTRRLVKTIGTVKRKKSSIFGATAIAFSPDGKWVASAHYPDIGIRMWNVSEHSSRKSQK